MNYKKKEQNVHFRSEIIVAEFYRSAEKDHAWYKLKSLKRTLISNRIKKNCLFSYTCEAMNNRSTTRNQIQQSKVSQTLTKNISFCLKPTCSVKHFFFSSGFHETRNEFVNFKRIRQFQREIWNCNLKNSRRLSKLSE